MFSYLCIAGVEGCIHFFLHCQCSKAGFDFLRKIHLLRSRFQFGLRWTDLQLYYWSWWKWQGFSFKWEAAPPIWEKFHDKFVLYLVLSAKFIQFDCESDLKWSSPVYLLGVLKKYRRLINNRTKGFCLIFIVFRVWNKMYRNLDFEMKTVKIRWKLSETHYFKVDHSKFYKPNFGDFWVVNFPISYQSRLERPITLAESVQTG